MEEPAPEDVESYVCDTSGCVMKGRTQPQEDGSSTLSYDNEGNAHVFQVGGPPTNENNVPSTIAQLRSGLPAFDVSQILGREDGADVLLKCTGCGTTTEGQVVTTVNGHLAAEARKLGHALSSEQTSVTEQRVVDTIQRKTQRYAAPETMRDRLLVIDATIDVFWTALFDPRRVEEAAALTPWYGVVLTSPGHLKWVKGTRPRCTCPNDASIDT